MPCTRDITTLFNTRAKMALIGLFASRPPAFRVTGRAAARLVKLSPPGAHAALKALYSARILTREIFGKQHVYSLNADEIFVKEAVVPFFQKALKQYRNSSGVSKKTKG